MHHHRFLLIKPAIKPAYSLAAAALFLTAAYAGQADVLGVETRCNLQRQCDFAVTVMHDDSGWDHYANRWEILNPAGEVIATRELQHPHENEQPFTRFLNGVAIPADVDQVTLRAHDSVHGYGGKEVTVELLFDQD